MAENSARRKKVEYDPTRLISEGKKVQRTFGSGHSNASVSRGDIKLLVAHVQNVLNLISQLQNSSIFYTDKTSHKLENYFNSCFKDIWNAYVGIVLGSQKAAAKKFDFQSDSYRTLLGVKNSVVKKREMLERAEIIRLKRGIDLSVSILKDIYMGEMTCSGPQISLLFSRDVYKMIRKYVSIMLPRFARSKSFRHGGRRGGKRIKNLTA